MMKAILPLAAALMLGAAPALAEHDSYKEPAPVGPGPSLYERISAHYGPMGRDVKERYRDGPCKIYRRWEKDGDYEESIKCRAPRRD
ncbi:hypothetical protein [Hyphomicrobium sp. CS1GBMeth3]|uniref:hypothetical protein n=1 Tax=Hyphomicrobium sp. CS1GBMeth3 TaxID=1892845 RepID=UPI000930979C|nr:hypothetical protein [Hyphomicrobium sp. CS1GBMeth3]